MTTLTVGQCLTSFKNEYVVSAVNLADDKISYTILVWMPRPAPRCWKPPCAFTR
ncbi:hypothetical protein [Citrobacter sp. Y3]|uniref:hypothetical protein n=1 Tax=Citrobacter sp. Y3 TaxID=2716879 RepID=UPI001F0F662A|nr:hypothetical protein [Citrobacter sp. Y3]